MLDGVFRVALQLLGVALRFLSGTFPLKLLRTGRLPNALFNLAGGFVGHSGCLVSISAHVETFLRGHHDPVDQAKA